MTDADFQLPNFATLKSLGGRKVMVIILATSAGVLGFLFWLLYFKPAASYASGFVPVLPAVNAAFNALSAVFLILAYRAIKRRQIKRHMQLIFAALGSSVLFFIGYVVYHSFHGDTKFAGHGLVRPIYFFILITHILLSAVVVPMILTSLYLALSGKLSTHRRVSRVTFPIWLYVSVTGVVIFILLKGYNG